MALIVKYKFQNVDTNGNSVTLLPQFPSGVSYTKTDVVEGNITTRVIETDDLSKVTYIRFGCNEGAYVTGAWEYLTEILDINISYVSTFYRMFRGCKLLNKIDVSNWNTNKVTNMTSMFDGCVKLTQLDVSNFDTSNVTSMSWMFNGCSQLTQLDVSKWVTNIVTNMNNMFYNCPKLTQLDVSNFDTSKVTRMDYMFNGCSQLTQLDVSNFDTSKVTNMSNMFYNCNVKNVGLIYCSEDTINKLANCITSPCNFYVTNKTYTSPNPLVKYVMYREDKKSLLYYNDETRTWEKPILRQWDSIEKHSDGKYYYHKRSGEVVLNGEEQLAWNFYSYGGFGVTIPDLKQGVNGDTITSYSISNSLTPVTYNEMPSAHTGCYSVHFTTQAIVIKSDYTTVDEFKVWLKSNPVIIVYQLAEEKVYECTDLDLITYADETSLMVESGVIVPKTTLKIHQNITNITTILQEKVSVLENNVGYATEIFVDSKIEPINNEIDNINTDLIGVSESIEGSSISVDSKDGYLKDVEILGNTIQDPNNLADIRSVGDKLEGQELYEIPVLSTGKNLSTIASYGQMNSNPTEADYSLVNCEATTYTISYDLSVSNNTNTNMHLCVAIDKDGKRIPSNIIRISEFNNKRAYATINIPTKGLYEFRISQNNGDFTGIYSANNIQIEEGTVVTPYEPYKEDKLTILSPTPLEKVGDVADRIVCKDGVWGVEKNIYTITSDAFYVHSNKKMWYVYTDRCPSWISKDVWDKVENRIICNYYKEIATYNEVTNGVGIFIDHKGTSPHIIIGTGDANITSLPHDLEVKYQLTQPQFIPLPYNQQIKLRTFANKTNIHFECEIEPTLKASVPKSLGATVNSHSEQIDNLGKELDKVKKLEESTALTVTTESDFTTVAETSNGYFEDVKLKGRTLVNLYPKLDAKNYKSLNGAVMFSDDIITIKADGDWKNFVLKKDVLPLKTSTYYTFVIHIIDNTIEGDRPIIHFGDTLGTEPSKFSESHAMILTAKKGIYTFKLKTKDSFDNVERDTRDHLTNGASGGTIAFKYMILEGDHTQNPPSFFEGLKSVGDGVDEVSVESVKGDGNLCEGNELNISIKNGASGTFSKDIVFRPTNDSVAYFVDCEGGQLNNGNVAFRFLDKSKNILGTPNYIPTNLPNYNFKFSDKGIKYSDVYYLKVFWNDKVGKDVMISNLTFISGNVAPTKHITHQPNKKRILYYNNETQTWEKPILRQWDSIEKHSDGKYYYHKRSGEVVLNGSESWENSPVNSIVSEGYIIFNSNILHGIQKTGSSYVVNNFSYMPYDKGFRQTGDLESISDGGGYRRIFVRIKLSKLSSPDLEGFKAWLQANPTTVVYQLEEEKVYECTNLDLITYADETNLVIKSGALNPKVTLKVHQNITNIITILQNKVSVLENVFIQGLKQVLAGDMQSLAYMLYPEDFENIEQSIDETSLGEQQDDPTDE